MAWLVIGLMLLTSAGGSIGGNSIEALFFSRFGVESLPAMYMALGAVVFVTSLVVTVALARVARDLLYVSLPFALAWVLVAERVLVGYDLPWFYPVMWLAMNVIGTLQGLFTWGLASAVCDTRQAKRLFPLFAAGGILGAVLGGLATQPLVKLLRAENLLLVWAVALGVSFVLAWRLVPPKRTALRASRGTRRNRHSVLGEMQKGFLYVRQAPLMRWIALSAVLFSVCFFSLQLPFTRAATVQFPDADELAGFFGALQALTTGAAFLLSLFGANRMFARFGAMTMFLVFPILYVIGFAVLTVYSPFSALVSFKFAQTLWMMGITGAAYQTTMNVIPAERRDQTRAFMDGVPGQAGTVIAGVLLLVGDQFLQPQQLFIIGLAAALATTYFVWRAKRAYADQLVIALREGQPQVFIGDEEPFGGYQRDAAAVAVIIQSLHPDHKHDTARRRVAAEVLGYVPVPAALDALVATLRDDDEEVCLAALRGVARSKLAAALLEVASCLRHPSPAVRAQAITTLDRLTPYKEGLIALITPQLDDPDLQVRAQIAAFLLRYRADETVRQTLSDIAAHPNPHTRTAAMTAIRRWHPPAAFEVAAKAVDDPHSPVRQMAALALAQIDAQQAVPVVINLLGDADRAVRAAAAEALGRAAEAALMPVANALPREPLTAGALQALQQLPAGKVAPQIIGFIQSATAEAQTLFGWWQLFATSATDSQPNSTADRQRLLSESLQHQMQRLAIYALRAIALLEKDSGMSVAIEHLQSRSLEQRANALETLDASPKRLWVRPLLKFWEPVESPPAEMTIRVHALRQLLTSADSWLRACAALVAGDTGDADMHQHLMDMAQHDPDPVVRDAARSACGFGGQSALAVVERILFLRQVPLFARLTPAECKHIAQIAREKQFAPRSMIVRQGEPGDEMFIIVSGNVQVLARDAHGQSSPVALRGVGAVTGEMAIIVGGRRTATLQAQDNVRALCLDAPGFNELLNNSAEIRLAIMRQLCERLKQASAARAGVG